jgi:hypothetical protein
MPVLGIRYGMQDMAAQLGGAVENGSRANSAMRKFARGRPLAGHSGSHRRRRPLTA